jgi:hypothetical protein
MQWAKSNGLRAFKHLLLNGLNERKQMLHEAKVSVTFYEPVKGRDINDGEIFMADKHWITAEFCRQDAEMTSFISSKGEVVASAPTKDIKVIRFPVIGPTSKLVTTRTSKDYIKDVKKVRSGAWSRWTDEEDDQLYDEVEKGYSLHTMAGIHNRTEKAIFSRLQMWDLEGGYEWPEHGTRIPETSFIPVEEPTRDYRLTCLNCGLEIFEPPCQCWKKSIYL